MTQEPARAVDAVKRAAELRAQLAAVTRQTADVVEESARVRDELADTHDAMAGPRLDPRALRDHAQRDRAFAEAERRQAEGLDQPPS